MKLVINKNISGWVMTGLIGRYGKWFIGLSHSYSQPVPSAEKIIHRLEKEISNQQDIIIDMARSLKNCKKISLARHRKLKAIKEVHNVQN